MTKPLVQRLREETVWEAPAEELMREAADEIERLQAELALTHNAVAIAERRAHEPYDDQQEAEELVAAALSGQPNTLPDEWMDRAIAFVTRRRSEKSAGTLPGIACEYCGTPVTNAGPRECCEKGKAADFEMPY